jgi:hypothetical protein
MSRDLEDAASRGAASQTMAQETSRLYIRDELGSLPVVHKRTVDIQGNTRVGSFRQMLCL